MLKKQKYIGANNSNHVTKALRKKIIHGPRISNKRLREREREREREQIHLRLHIGNSKMPAKVYYVNPKETISPIWKRKL